MNTPYEPPYTLTPRVLTLAADIGEALGRERPPGSAPTAHDRAGGSTGEISRWRRGHRAGRKIVHLAPPAGRVPGLMNDLLGWLKRTDAHPLIASCVFHYELEFIHPFADGNGRMGRLWQPLTALACMKKLSLTHRPTFRKNYLQPALDAGLIERTLPDKPNSSLQQYRLRQRR